MSKLETNLKEIQSFVNYCIDKGYSSYSYSFSVKRELLSAEQASEATRKELDKVSDELMILLRENPILKSFANNIETSDFLWDSTFVEALSSSEKKKYAAFNVASPDTDEYKKTPSRYDEYLPYLSAVINYGILNRYISYLKAFVPAEKP